jgi:hypothetical protein
MRSIYHAATRVIVRLGEATVTSDNAMEYVDLGTPNMDLQPNGDVMELFCRPWWKRIWVVQEVASARRDPIIRCGKKEVLWSSLSRFQGKVPFAGWMQYLMDMRERPRGMQNVDDPFEKAHASIHVQMFFEVVGRLRDGHLLSWRDAFALGYIMESTDPRDLIFASMGLFDDQGIPPVVPYYRKDAASVHREAAAASFQHTEGLATLTLTVSLSQKYFPTWTPDMVNGVPGIFLVTNTGVYRAAGETTARLRWSQGRKVLHAS